MSSEIHNANGAMEAKRADSDTTKRRHGAAARIGRLVSGMSSKRSVGVETAQSLPELSEADAKAREVVALEFEQLAETARHGLDISLQTRPEMAWHTETATELGGPIHEDSSEIAGNTFVSVANALIERLHHDTAIVTPTDYGVAIQRDPEDPLADGRIDSIRHHMQTLMDNGFLFAREPKVVNGVAYEDPYQAAIDSEGMALQLTEMVETLQQGHRHHSRPESVTWRMSKPEFQALVGLAELGATVSRVESDPATIAAMKEYFEASSPNVGDVYAQPEV